MARKFILSTILILFAVFLSALFVVLFFNGPANPYIAYAKALIPSAVVAIIGVPVGFWVHSFVRREELERKQTHHETVGSISGSDENGCPISDALAQIGIVGFLSNRMKTSELLENLSGEAKSIKVLAISSMTTILDTGLSKKFAALLEAGWQPREIKWLLLNPESRYVAVRVEENPERDKDDLVSHIESALGIIRTAKSVNNLGNLQIRLYSERAVFRVIIIDDKAYVSYYPKRGSGKNVPLWVVQRGKYRAWLFDAIDKHFESLWEHSDELSEEHLSKLLEDPIEDSG